MQDSWEEISAAAKIQSGVGPGVMRRGPVLILLSASCVALGKWLNLSVTGFLIYKGGGNKSSSPTGLLWGLDELTRMKL